MTDNRFEREEMLIGKEALARLEGARVCLFGVGGVGSYAAEALARAGVGAIDIIDNDTVSITNINRQLCALTSTVGQNKIDVVESRLLDINPELKIRKYLDFVLPENIGKYDFSEYDYVIDAVDTVSAKLAIIEAAKHADVEVLSCMGTGNKLDPTALTVTDIAKTSTCPLARVMRRELKTRGISHVKVIYSTESPIKIEQNAEGKKAVPASISFVPSVAGLIAAGEAVKHIIKDAKEDI
ncbi:MAG: tRNA threonylcarbamoyladenosine dehydratase [Clostridia bacterium]|nr:tRNA threonylcarbamoyladenosine dehydratase [Clostridia bacterium]